MMSKNFEKKFQTTYTHMGLTANNMDNTNNSEVIRSLQTQTKCDYHKVKNNNVLNTISNNSECSNDHAITEKYDRTTGHHSPLKVTQNYLIDDREHDQQIYENFDEFNFYHDINKYYPIISASKSADCINISQLPSSSISEKQSNENIYENVCEKCGQIYSDDKCLICNDVKLKRKSDPVKRSQSNLFSGFIDSIRQKTKIKEKSKSKRKLEIIHNVDSVFKTNKSFDLSEICRLKANVNKCEDHKIYNQNIYGKLRTYQYQISSHENLIKLPDVDLMQQPPVNESNFAHLDATTFPVCTQSTPDLVEHEEQHFFANGDEKQIQHINEPLYENLNNRVYRKDKINENSHESRRQTQLQSEKLQLLLLLRLHDITDRSLIEWMTSLKKHTEEYCEETNYNVKCIPSRSFDCSSCYGFCSAIAAGSSAYSSSLKSGSMIVKCESKQKFQTMNECSGEIARFKANLYENRSKRKAIYLKDEKHFNAMFIVLKNSLNGDQLSDEKICDKNSNFENDHTNDPSIDNQEPIIESEDTMLRPKNRHLKMILNEGDEPNSFECMEVKTIRKYNSQDPVPVYQRKSISKRKIAFIKLLMSISFNKIILTYDTRLKMFLKHMSQSKLDTNELWRLFQDSTFPRIKDKISDFEKSSLPMCEKHFEDFEIRQNNLNIKNGKCFKDFEKQDLPDRSSAKLLSDYEWKKKTPKTPIPPPRHVVAIPPKLVRRENIYQPIWTFQTVGYAKESDFEGTDEDIYYDSNNFYEEIDYHEWEVAEEFSYSNELKEEVSDGISEQQVFVDPYQRVCILFNAENPKYNQMTYIDVDNCQRKPIMNENFNANNESIFVENLYEKRIQIEEYQILDSVRAWQKMLMRMDYLEDEEDINIYIGDILTTKAIDNNFGIESSPFNFNINDERKGQSPERQNKFLSENEVGKKDSGFLNKLQTGRIDITKGSLWSSVANRAKENFETFSQLNFDSGEPRFISRKPIGYQTYGVTLEELEKDEIYLLIPKFVCECIRIIEQDENIQTSGIYRASGKKESIDKVKKKMDEKSKKGSKYAILKTEDVHTITGALKQFFRELKTELIPIHLFRNLPNDLEMNQNLVFIKQEIHKIDPDTKATLKFLIEHLRRVDQNNEYNLMTASNLSIVWGACLFTSSVTDTDTFETSELIKKNMLVRILIQRYNEIFNTD